MKKNIRRILVLLLGIILGLSTYISREIFNKTNIYLNENYYVQFANGSPIDQSLVFGINANPTDLDPHLCYDDAEGWYVISQVCEGLYKFDVTDPAAPLIPVLATALPTFEGTSDKPELVIPLRTGVTFHDGTPFNATVVKWNFDRLNYFFNYSANQYLPAPFNVPFPESPIWLPGSYFIQKILFTVGGIPVINETIVDDLFTIRIKMNMPKALFINLLAFHSTFFHSPTSVRQQGKELDYLAYADGDVLIGTGPFIFQHYLKDIEVKFIGNSNYWQGAPKLTNITFSIIKNDTALNQGVLDGVIDLYDAPRSEFYDQFKADPDITLLEAGPMINTSYMGFNGEMVNTTFRKAISYAINYSYLIDVVLLGNGYRLKSPIPEGIPMSNCSFNYPVFDHVYAQSIMQSMGYGVGFTTDAQWLAVADSGGWPGTQQWNITAYLERTTPGDFALIISDNLRYIGLDVPVVQITLLSLINCMIYAKKQIPMYMISWIPDYIDPENYLSLFFTNRSPYCVETYDYELEMLMLAGETTVDIADRQAIYNEIQKKLVEELYFFAWIAVSKNYDVYQSYVFGWIPNAIYRLDLYSVFIDFLPPEISIHSPIVDQVFGTDPPDYNITIEDESAIISRWYTLDGGLSKNFSGLIGIIDETLWSELDNGPVSITFYAMDEAGKIGSESVTVIKEIPTEEEPVIPGYNLFFLFGLLSVVVIFILKKVKNT